LPTIKSQTKSLRHKMHVTTQVEMLAILQKFQN